MLGSACLPLTSHDGKIPTALILAGPNIASHHPLFEQLASRIRDQDRIGPVVVLTSKDATNLKTALKKLIRDSTQQDEGVDDEDETIIGRKVNGMDCCSSEEFLLMGV